MTRSQGYTVDPRWRIALRDAGINAENVLVRAGLPAGFLSGPGGQLSTREYFRLWEALEQEVDDPRLPILIGESMSAEAFSPPIFAALCSRNLKSAAERLAEYKRLIAPMTLSVDETGAGLELTYDWVEEDVVPPWSLSAGTASVEEVASVLAMSKRTLQRRLREEGTSFQATLRNVRRGLAAHYLLKTDLPSFEISFLLGFDDPNSFHRAYHNWTGSTPERARRGA